eukprot:gene2499-2655_t
MISDSTLSTARNLCLIDIIDSDWEQDVLSDDDISVPFVKVDIHEEEEPSEEGLAHDLFEWNDLGIEELSAAISGIANQEVEDFASLQFLGNQVE